MAVQGTSEITFGTPKVHFGTIVEGSWGGGGGGGGGLHGRSSGLPDYYSTVIILPGFTCHI